MPADSGEWKRETGKGEREINLIRLERKGWDWDRRVLLLVLSDSIKGDRGPVVQCSAGQVQIQTSGYRTMTNETKCMQMQVCHSKTMQ